MALSKLSFAFGGDSEAKTPEELARRRALAEQLAQGAIGRTPRNTGEGLSAIGQALAFRGMQAKNDKAEAAGRESASGAFAPIAAALGGGFPAAPGGAPSASASAPMDYASSRVAQAHGDPVDLSGSKQAFVDTLLPAAIEASKRTGIDPRIIVAQAAQETGWGKSAPGNNYFGIKSHGKGGGQTFTTHEVIDGKRVKINDSFRQFGSPADSVAGYADFMLENPRYGKMRSAQGLDAQLAALGASGYATDPNYASSVGSIARSIPMPSQGPVQVASLDPSAGLAEAGAEQGLSPDHPGLAALARIQQQEQSGLNPQAAGQPIATDAPTQRVMGAMMDQQPMTGGAAMSMQGADGPMPGNVPMPLQGAQAISQQPRQQIAQALQQPMTEMAGNTQPIQQGNPSLQMLMQAAQNPWLNDNQRAIVNSLLGRALEEPEVPEAFTLGEGQIRYDGEGNVVARGGEKSDNKPSAILEYEYAKQQGFPGSFQDWEASKKGGMNLQVGPDGTVSFQQGSNIKPMTEGQSKDAVFSTRAEGALPLIDQHGDALTSLGETAASNLPVVGNYLKSPEFQQAEQAGKEFLQAILRKDTGAAITVEETAEYGSVYLPRPGDSPEVLAQKKVSRIRALEAIKAGMPPQAILAQEKALANTGQPAAPDTAPEKPLSEMSDEELEAIINGQ